MSDQDTPVVESSAPVEVQREAEAMGWIPPSRFRGDPERFVDADLYIKRGNEVLPIVREQNKRLHGELDALRAQSAQTAQALKAAQDAITQMEERHTVETHKAVQEAREAVKAQLAEASEAGDHKGVAELTDQLTKLREAEKAPAKAAQVQVTPAQFVPPPDMAEWNRENPWFGTNRRKTALALGIAEELRESGETSTGRAFFDKVKSELDKELGVAEPRTDKVEGGRGNGGDSGSSTPRGKGFASLPKEARDACDADARTFVGAGKKYKTQAEWRTRYAEIYFGE
jgi:hypothetical protein